MLLIISGPIIKNFLGPCLMPEVVLLAKWQVAGLRIYIQKLAWTISYANWCKSREGCHAYDCTTGWWLMYLSSPSKGQAIMEQLERILKCMMPNPTQHTDQPAKARTSNWLLVPWHNEVIGHTVGRPHYGSMLKSLASLGICCILFVRSRFVGPFVSVLYNL